MNQEPGAAERDAYLLEDMRDSRASRRRWIVIALLIAGALLLAFFFFGKGKESGADTPAAATGQADSQIPTISVAVPGRGTVREVVSATGSLAARREMPVGVVGEGGQVTRVLVEPGAWVKKGQTLAEVDNSVQRETAQSLAAQVRAAEADAELAQSELDRAQQLVGRGFISKADLERKRSARDSANARVRVAQAQLQETRARNARLDIRAPEAGLVLTRAVEPGQIVSAGSGVLFRIAKGGEMEMLARLAEGDLRKVSVGVPAEVTPVGSDKSFKGQVWQVSPVIDPQTRQGIARIALAYNSELRPGGFASARIVAGANSLPLLPESAVLSDNDGNYVYVLNDKDEAVRRDVKVGNVSDDGVSIAGGLNGTERVVLSAGAFLNPGQKVDPVLKTLGK
ncbi:efflux RND transporter periplasmic adaptor subunit [Stakelama pacifica]|uniref:RND family efflux transporter MFP subunit n=1 Tax=Stakelama pacifica TaxID=517720 RepID=A0A4R6FVI6_9SPHN|nr:efflux RND transporter periplasmic adaptor subunit [Stakelama pacifica]TDN85747.1 RND family efflux transporter MFP subunit [Stakelama pacifica]GGO91745.1 hemolysin secretion protein D [Stakelama pacifica]